MYQKCLNSTKFKQETKNGMFFSEDNTGHPYLGTGQPRILH